MDIGKRVITAEGIAVHDALHKAANVKEADLVPQEVRHGGLVRAVGGAGGQTALADCLLAGLEAAEGLVIRTGLGRRSGQVSAY